MDIKNQDEPEFMPVLGKGVKIAPASNPKIAVDMEALARVLHALNGPPHYIRELQACVNLPGSPLALLHQQYNEGADKRNRHPVKEKYLEEAFPTLMDFGNGPDGTVGVCTTDSRIDLLLPPEQAASLIAEYNKLHARMVQLAQALDMVDSEKFHAIWYG